MLISCLPARAADTELDVAITVVRLIAAAAAIGKLRPRFRKGTRKMPPPRPSSAPRLPATVPAAKMISVRTAVTAGIKESLKYEAVGVLFKLQSSYFKLPSLGELARRLFDRALLGLFPRCAVSTRE